MVKGPPRLAQRIRESLSLERISPWLAARVTEFSRNRAVGRAPELLAFSILQLTLTPSLELAADFATDAVDGRLSRSLSAHRLGTVSGVRAYEAFAADWAVQDRSIRRAVTLMTVAMNAPADRRTETLEDALGAVLDGARDRVVEFSAAVRGPAMGIYAFGVMLPLALVGLLPVLAASGGGVSMLGLAVVYDGFIPAGLTASGLWLWARRPAVTDVSFDTEILKHARQPSIGLGSAVGTAVLAYFLATLLVPDWVAPIVALGVGTGTGTIVALEPAIEAQDRLDRLEERLPDVLTIVGQRLADGEPVETTIDTVAERFDGPVGQLLESGVKRQQRSGDPLKRSFLGPNGTVGDVPSERAAVALRLVLSAAEYGPTGGSTLLRVGEYLEALIGVEQDARRELSQTTSTLRQTAIVFAPAIAGVTVALATGMGAVDGSGQALDVGSLGQVIGIYVLLLGVVLPSLAVVLARGFAPVRMAYRSGIALAVGAVVYPLSFVAARTLVYV